jgi:hypothetical protein
MFRWLRKLLQIEDRYYNPLMPHGHCEAGLGWHAGMRVTCGTLTNMQDRGYWICSRHPVPEGTPQKEVRV